MKLLCVTIQRVALVAICAALPRLAQAQSPAGDEAAVRAASLAYLAALQQGDLNAIVAAWTPQGTFVDAAGTVHVAREMARAAFSADAPRGEPGEVHPPTTSVRFVTGEVAVEQTVPTAPGESSNFIAIWVKRDQRWLLDYLREISSPTPPPPAENPLEELGWLVGKWRTEGEGLQATIETKWSEENRFLLQEFEIDLPGQTPFRVHQRIGWDPASEQIRSWLFRSDGGFEEGAWARSDNVWIVKRVGVLPDGARTSTVNLWHHEPPAKCWFKAFQERAGKGDDELSAAVMLLQRVDAP